ncbi:MAG: trimethylamine methyltransferase family protein [Gammaproteobacteria bacterium]|nr:trimethylamine methyltransferase family protein [Gammaproteobacteria bacterium]
MSRASCRRRARSAGVAKDDRIQAPAYLKRRIPAYELLDEEALVRLEEHAEWLLSEIGIEIRDDPETLKLFRVAGATIDGELLRFDPGHVRALCATAPKTYTMHARNPARNIEFGGDNLIFGSAYGSPFVTDLEGGRRYGTLVDFQNFIKLTYLSPWLHHQSGTICEPVDIAVNKRHLDMVYAHLRYSDKPFMGSVTAPERAEDSLAMARIVFGEDFMREHLVIQGNINVNSPLVYDNTMTAALRTYAAANQGNVISPFIMGGAMSPVTQPALIAQAHAEVMVGIALTQLVCPGAPVVYGSFLTTMDLKTGAPTFGTPESTLATLAISQLSRRMGLPFRCGGHLTASKVADAQAMMESTNAMNPAIMAGANFIFQAAGWLESGLTIGYEKFVMDAEQCGAIARVVEGLTIDDDQLGVDAYREAGAGTNFLGVEHTMRHYRHANFRAELTDANPFEQWSEAGSQDMQQRACRQWKKMLAEYEMPAIDTAVDEALLDFIARRKTSMVDAWY